MAPGIISAATTASFLRLDSSLALLLTLFTNFLVPFTLPPLALWLLGLDLRISALDLSLRLALIVVLALDGRARHPPLPGRRAWSSMAPRSTVFPWSC